jgi:hypothetical protein
MYGRSILKVLKTRGLEYDDRVRKECWSLVRAGFDVRLLVLESSNEAMTRNVWDGVSATSLSLLTRRLFPRAKGLVFKLIEFNGRTLGPLLGMRGGVLWAHNRETAPVVAAGLLLRRLGRLDRVVWDQHELPRNRVMENPVRRYVCGRLMRACDAVVVANAERREFLRERLPEARDARFAVLENRADLQFAELPVEELPPPVSAWACGRPYLLLQGGAHPRRHFAEVVEAVIDRLDADIGIVVVGAHPESLDARLRERWGDQFEEHVYFTGWIPQMEISKYIDHAMASVVLYEPINPNSLYCAPNRLYQAVARGTPLIVGSNPPMATLVARHRVGVVLEGTGGAPGDIARAVEQIAADLASYRGAARLARRELLWEDQETEIARVLGRPAAPRSKGDHAVAEEPIAR